MSFYHYANFFITQGEKILTHKENLPLCVFLKDIMPNCHPNNHTSNEKKICHLSKSTLRLSVKYPEENPDEAVRDITKALVHLDVFKDIEN